MRYYLLFFNLCFAAVALQAQVCPLHGNMISSVSTECNGGDCGTLIRWTVSDDPAVTGYVIYEYLGGNSCSQEIARIADVSATTYLTNSIAPKGYTMAVIMGKQDQPLTQQHKQPEIISVDFNPCNYTADIRWSPYTGWDADNTEYAVYAAVNGASTYTLLAEHLADVSYRWVNAPTRVSISILVQAVNKSDVSAVSNTRAWTGYFDFPRLPAYISLSMLDYTDGKARLTFAIDPSTELTGFEVQRAAAGASFSSVASFGDKTTVTYTDEPGAAAYLYRIAAKNDCDSVAAVSDTLSNIVVTMLQEGNSWQLRWDNASLPSMRYTLRRERPQPVVLLSGSALTAYTDNIPSMLNESSLIFCYTLEGDTPAAKSRSTACTTYTPVVVMPDAIDPLSTTVNPQTGRARNQFGPVINVDPQTYSYRLTILNRNGAVVADINKTTADNHLNKSWDGRLRNGDPAPGEVFTYRLSVTFDGGYQQTMTGIVTVMYGN